VHNPSGNRLAEEVLDELWQWIDGTGNTDKLSDLAGELADQLPNDDVDEPPGVFQSGEAVVWALRATAETDPGEAVTESLFQSLWSVGHVVGSRLDPAGDVMLGSEYDALVGSNAATATELAYQEAALAEIERTRQPLSRDGARRLSARYTHE
jgi:hypothetical protein